MAEASRQTVLVAEDSDEDYAVLLRALRSLGEPPPVERVQSGDACIDYLDRAARSPSRGAGAAMPALVLLDLNMPGTDGREVLQYIKRSDSLRAIPVAVLTTSSNPRDIDACYQDGADSYIIKSLQFDKFLRTVNLMVQYWLDASVLPSPS